MANFLLMNRVLVVKPSANVDALYGPYLSLESACSAIPLSRRALGLTVGIETENGIEEYWWKSGTGNEDLVTKIEKINLTLDYVDDSEISIQEGEIVVVNFSISGRSTIQKGYLYRVVGNTEVFVSEITTLNKGNNSYQISNISTSGVYYYRIKVVDSSGSLATNTLGLEYLQFKINYGGISTQFNFTKLNGILIKNIYSVANQYFTCNISVRDDSFEIIDVALTNQTTLISLIPKDSLQNESNTYLGLNYYYLPAFSELEPLNGTMCYIKITYTENGETRYSQTSLFTLLDVNSLEFVPETSFTTYYENFPAYYYFQLKSGVENISVVLSLDESSDFDFENVTVATYKRFALKITPKNIKNNAVLKLNYSFFYNNVENIGSFEQVIGNVETLPEQSYYIPNVSTTYTDKKNIVVADDSDYSESGYYYKIIDTPIIEDSENSTAFILDMYCKINKTNDNSVKYLTIKYGTEEIGYVQENEIKCRNIITDTPLNEWILIGLGYNLKEQVPRTEAETSYYAIYINGMVVKNILIDDKDVHPLEYDPYKKLSIEIGNGIQVLKCFLYFKTNSNVGNFISPLMENSSTSIIYNNYISHSHFVEPLENLPILKLMRITGTEEENYFQWINQAKEDYDEDKIVHTTIFGNIGDTKADSMGLYDDNYTSQQPYMYSPASLFRQDVKIKKPAQKEYAVLCQGLYIINGNNLLEGVIVEVHTQGTSTLQYSIPNFKFTFWKKNPNEDSVDHFYPELILKDVVEGENEYYREYIYTAKCDYMDSSHLNNTPTCIYYNNLIKTLISKNKIIGSPSAATGGIDAIMGMPIILEISDAATSFSDTSFTNIGSFMLNVDKTGSSLGFEVNLGNNETMSCISFEGTSNDINSGAAGRFILNNTDLEYFEDESDINDAYDYTMAHLSEIPEPGSNDPIGDLVGYTYAQWCQFFSDGLEYRYPDNDIIKSKNGNLSKVMKLPHFKKLYRMWSWVSKSDTYSKEKYTSEFENYFDLDYCILYFIQLMIFGQTDNLGKNAMFDSWDGEHWYPRPYDLDSLSGLDNNGFDNIAPFVEIKPEFSLNYNSNYTYELKEANYLLESSLIQYGSQLLDRYHYSSNDSKLWINFYKNYKETIESFYNYLRTTKAKEDDDYTLYSPESIIKLCEDLLINVLGVKQYNQDFTNKYLANSDLRLAYGNRWNKFKKWITQRFAFCDSYFKASQSATYDATSAFTYNIKVESPLYVTQLYQAQAVTKFIIDLDSFSAGSSAATKTTLIVNLGSVLEAGLFKYVTKSNGDSNYTGLLKLDVSGNNKISGIIGLVGENLPNLRELNISNSTVSTLLVPASVRKLIADNVTLTNFSFAENSLIEEISLKNSTINPSISFSGLHNLKKLDLTGCKFKNNVTLAGLDNIENFIITDTSFEGQIDIQDGVNISNFNFDGLYLYDITFSGTNLGIKTLSFKNTIFGNSTINLNAISQNIENLYFDNCLNLTHLEITGNNSFLNIINFSLYGSSIVSMGDVTTEFDAGLLGNNISNLKRGSSNSPFTFLNTKITKIVNLNWTGTGENLFRDCINLVYIGGTLNLTDKIDYLFYRCLNLTTISTININTENLNPVISALYTFVMCNSLGYSNISGIIRKCEKVTTFNNACRCTQFSANLTIDLDYLFENNNVNSIYNTTSSPNIILLNLNLMFCASYLNAGGLITATNSLNVIGKIPNNATRCSSMFYGVNTLKVPYDILSEATALVDTVGMFLNITNFSFTGDNIPSITVSDVTYKNIIEKDFFPQELENLKDIRSMFCYTNVQTDDPELFKNLSNLEYCDSVFYRSSPTAFNCVENLNITNIWRYNPNLKSVAGCFSNIKNVYCAELNFNEALKDSSSDSINISGLFGLSSVTENSTIYITLDDIILGNVNMSRESFIQHSGTLDRVGTFLNRTVHITKSNNTNEGILLSKISGDCSALFKGATVYIDSNINKLDLSNVTKCTEMFMNCNLYKYKESGTYTDEDRKFVQVLLPVSCLLYSNMFNNSKVLSDLPELRSSSASDLSRMYQLCHINTTSVTLPCDYFAICKNNLKNVSYMFYSNHYITTIEYHPEKDGLFEGCVQLENVDYMFSHTYRLHKGIPINIFGTTQLPKISRLNSMFEWSAIFYGVEDGSNKWIDSTTFMPLINLTSINSIFNMTKFGFNSSLQQDYAARWQVKDSEDQDVYVINPDTFTFKNISDIRNSFAYTALNIPFKFSGFEYGQDAFFDSSLTEIGNPFVLDLNVSSIRNVSRMFYDIIPSGGSGKTITNLGAFVTKISSYPSIQKANIAGGLNNSDINSSLRLTTAEAESRSQNAPYVEDPTIYL